MSAPPIIHDLVRAFQKDERTYYDNAYSEAQVRISFIDPFFEALGWHPRPDTAYIAEWRDCIVEQPLNVQDEQHKKRADYTCRIGKTPVLIVEAKAPREDVFSMSTHALQIRSYAYSQGLPIGALFNFAQLAIYDGRVRPKKDDAYRVAQLETIRFTEYVEKWDLIESLLSKDAVQRGAQREYMQRRLAKGLIPVDQAILAEIDRWREELAHVIARQNPELSAETLGFAVGRIIDRILFLRVCEARGTEPEGQLKDLFKGTDTYQRLLKLFHLADERYNSGLFYFKEESGRAEKPDLLALCLQVEDKPLKQIISGLYYPDNLYEYSLIPVEILGQVYEQFLGKVIIVPRRGSGKVEDKPEVKKAGGVYYTPSYIVNYIVEHTVGKLVEGKTPKQIAKLRVLDPACGSGSFLLGAYQYLLDWYLKYYLQDGPAKHQKEISPDIYEGYRLTLRERKRILTDHIFGVDIDAQAVEVTKLSLLLKVLEGETHDTVESELKLRERALPDLGRNIKCGNSLIATDILSMTFPPTSVGGQKGGIRAATKGGSGSGLPPFTGGHKGGSGTKEGRALTDDEISRINPFDWHKEFPAIFKDGGFDAVIGNPPYIRIQTLKEWAPLEADLYKTRYACACKGNYDIYVVFVERGLSLLNPLGSLGFILPHKFFNAQYGQALRQLISHGRHLTEVVYFGDQQVFSNATTYTCLMFLSKAPADEFCVLHVSDIDEWRDKGHAAVSKVGSLTLSGTAWSLAGGQHRDLLRRLELMPVTLRDIADRIFQGLVTGCDPVFILADKDGDTYYSEATQKTHRIERDLMHPLCKGSLNIRRYHTSPLTKSILFPYRLEGHKATLYTSRELSKQFPFAWSYLRANRSRLEARERDKWKHDRWYAFGRSQNLAQMQQAKIMTPSIANAAAFTFDSRDHFFFVGSGGGGGGGYGITLNPNDPHNYCYILGLLNSRLLDLYLKSVSSRFGGGYYAFNRQYIERLPIRIINFSDKADKARHDKMVKLVERMLKLHQDLKSAQVEPEQEKIDRQIRATDEEIDRLVYELYGLTEDEIRIVESA